MDVDEEYEIELTKLNTLNQVILEIWNRLSVHMKNNEHQIFILQNIVLENSQLTLPVTTRR